MWRPDNWENPYEDPTGQVCAPAHSHAFEAGADAMHQADVEWFKQNNLRLHPGLQLNTIDWENFI